MYAAGLRRLLGYNTNRTYSPIVLNTEWPASLRLLFMIFLTLLGTFINGFFVASFFVEQQLRKVGNVYLACVGLADMIITTGVMPTVAVCLLSGMLERAEVCYGLQFLSQASSYMYGLLFMMVSIETYIRLCQSSSTYRQFLAIPVGLVSIVLIIVSFAASAVGVYLGLDYDYCTRENYGNSTFRLVTGVAFEGFPFVCTMTLLFITAKMLRARALRLSHYRRSKQYERDYTFTKLNITCYLSYVLAWLPYLIIINYYPDTTDNKFYSCVWIGLSRSIITTSLYSVMNKNFRHAYVHLFYYCCCKSTMAAPYNNRHRRAFDYKVPTGDLRVHLMHPPVVTSAPRAVGVGNSRNSHTMQI